MTKYLGELFIAGIIIRTIKGLSEFNGSNDELTSSVDVAKVRSSNFCIDLDRMV